MKSDFDLAIIGSGFSASLLAMIARRIGLSVILIERGSHPRFAIGESTSPLMNLIIEQLAERYDLPRLLPLATFGAWQRNYPEVVCGLKRGFTYFKHESATRYRAASDRSNQLLVAASPNNEVADTHWLRADVDHFLLKEAIALGAEYLDRTALHEVERTNGNLACLLGERVGQAVRVRARLTIDASGPNGFLSQKLKLSGPGFNNYPATQSLFSHFIGVHRCDQMPDYAVSGLSPYPMDDAALHHVFDGGWMWVLRFGNGTTSAGIAVTDELAADLKLSEGEAAWDRFLKRFPSIAAQFAEAEAIREFTWMPRLASRVTSAAGPGWALLPSAAAFVDPLFSTGMPLALLGVERIGKLLEEGIDSDKLRAYDLLTLAEADHTAQFISACYAAFPRFENFTAYSMFYFAAASYSEMARRLGVRHLVQRFLASDRQPFAMATRVLGKRLRKSTRTSMTLFAARVKESIEPLNIAGLCDEGKRNWYGVDLNDVAAGAEKFGKTTAEINDILRHAVWAQKNVTTRLS
ncbi:MAG: tryptophan 7-halogenase [Acidobacteriota bacterium]